MSERALSGGIHGRVGPEGALIKIVWSEVSQRAAEIAQDVLGAEALCGETGREVVHARSLTIAGGTTQVNKNIVAERVLGLPRGR